MDEIEKFDRVFRLVRLKTADQVPARHRSEMLDLVLRLLHPVLTQNRCSCCYRFPNANSWNRFGHDNELDFGGSTTCPLRRRRYPVRDGLDVVGYGHD